MADTTFVDGVTPVVADWLNDVNDFTYSGELKTSTTPPTTGIYKPATNTVALATSSIERMRIDTSGNVVIGHTSALGKFGVYGSAPEVNIMDSGANSTRLWMKATNTDVQIGTNYALSNVPIKFVAGGGSATLMTIDTSGNVGVGGTPAAKFDVLGGSLGRTYIFYNGTSTNYFDCDTQIWRNAAGAEGMRINASGNVGIGTAGGSAKLEMVSGGNTSSSHAMILRNSSGLGLLYVRDDGLVTVGQPVGLGYGSGTGAGGTVVQGTSRTTGVILNKPTGAITMFSAAGSATWSGFLVNNSLVAANDTIVTSVQSSGATNTYLTHVAGVAAGAFYIMFATTGGTAVDAPIINFSIIKGATS